ncbi:MAG: hypothetical protein O7F16_06385 [Acidobacteria bacterium]|nr:hypothetical protein [Acidobacteriota bacterium]
MTGVHVAGALLTPGDVTYEGQPRMYGALLARGRIMGPPGPSAPLEVWYDHDLRDGMVHGTPLVYVALGTRQKIY